MQKYAKKMIAVACLFFLSVLWYQSDDAQAPNTQEDNNIPWFNIACVPAHAALQGLDTDLRKRGLSQFSKNMYARHNNQRPSEHRCYFRVNPAHIGCFNPRLVTREYLEANGFKSDMAFPGGAPGQLCYFKKEFANNYINLMTILKRNGTLNDLNQYIVPSGAQAVNKLAEPLRSEIQTNVPDAQESAEEDTDTAESPEGAAEYSD
jgi:hypothetical protein